MLSEIDQPTILLFLVNFLKLFKELNNIGYKGGLTLETNRLNRPVFYAKKNLNFIKKFIN